MTANSRAIFPFLAGASEMSRLMRRHDWSTSPLGEPTSWSHPLQMVAGIILASNQPMFVSWGPDKAILYNDAYADILGGHHPAALGRPFFEVWPELQEVVGPILDRGHAGEPTYRDDIQLVLQRNGYPEETHFSFFYAPVRDEDGSVAGVLCACSETTKQVAALREQREAETRNRQILDSAIDFAIIATDLDGLVTRWNAGAEHILGWTEAEMLGQSIDVIFTPEDRAEDRSWIEMRAAAAGGVGADDRWHIRQSGERFWASGEMTPLKNAAEQIVGFVKVLRDRTTAQLAETRLRESEARYRGTAEAIPGFVYTASSAGVLTYISPRWLSYSGHEMALDRADSLRHFVHPEDVARATEGWAKSVETGELYEMEYRLRAADGSYRWWLSRALPTRGDDGEILFWTGACTDIQAIVEARDAFARSREELEDQVAERTAERNRMWQLSANIMLVAKFDSTITAINPAWTALLGWMEPELLGRKFLEFVHPSDVAATEAATARLADGAKVLNFENRYRHKDGSYRWMSWTGVPDETFIHALGRDCTQEREQADALSKAEEALRQSQKMEAVGQLTGGVAHDFNNLLTGISGSLELVTMRLAQGRFDNVERFVAAAQEAASRAAALTHRLLAFSRRQTLDPQYVQPNRLIGDMEEMVRRTVGPEIAITTSLAVGLWPTLCDQNQLENALLNLCINARDAMPDGGRLTIETANIAIDARSARERDMSKGEYVEICVSDNGVGMTPEVAKRAFDPFFTTKPLGEGTGLGLSMIYGFVNQSGGQVRLYSEVGHGTTVRLYLPRYSGTTREELAQAKRLKIVGSETGEVVLLVDDEPTVRMLVKEVLDELGYTTVQAEDGLSGLHILQSDMRIDLLISDVGMPGMNGRQMVDAARIDRPDLKVLFITGYAEKAVLGDGQLGPGLHVLAKPFSMELLANRIKTIIVSG